MELFQQPLRPINLGLESFYDSMASQGAEPVAVDWRPPLEGYAELTHTRAGIDIDAANAEAVRRICAGRPMLVGMGIARDVIPGFAPSGKARLLITHSGPPITWARMCGPTRGAIMGALIYEGLAETPEDAAALAASGEIEFAPCHHYHAVGPMAGIISPSMPVFIVKNEATGDRRVRHAKRRVGQGAPLRRIRPGGDPPPQMDGDDPLPRAAGCAGSQWADRPAQHDRPGVAHGRRVPQPQQGRHVALHPHDRPRAGRGGDRIRQPSPRCCASWTATTTSS